MKHRKQESKKANNSCTFSFRGKYFQELSRTSEYDGGGKDCSKPEVDPNMITLERLETKLVYYNIPIAKARSRMAGTRALM